MPQFGTVQQQIQGTQWDAPNPKKSYHCLCGHGFNPHGRLLVEIMPALTEQLVARVNSINEQQNERLRRIGVNSALRFSVVRGVKSPAIRRLIVKVEVRTSIATNQAVGQY